MGCRIDVASAGAKTGSASWASHWRNGIIELHRGELPSQTDATVVLSTKTLNQIAGGKTSFGTEAKAGTVQIRGDQGRSGQAP